MPGERHDIMREVHRLLDQLDKVAPSGDWVDAFVEHDCIGTDEAAFIADASRQTIRRHAAEAAAAGRPIGVCIARSVWLISLRRLLDWIGQNDGLPALVAAEARTKKRSFERAASKIVAHERAATS
jgi:hypothetical protein